jgi:uncharacterized protein (TIGR00725 family)
VTQEMKVTVGVMGSAGGELAPEVCAKVFRLGEAIGSADCILITGACPGLPHEAVKGAKSAGGLTVGISPGHTLQEHVELYGSPTDHLDVLIFTGSGLMGREITAVRSCDIVVVVGGRSGTLGEFAIAYDEGKLIGVLKGTGGIAENVDRIVGFVDKDTGAEVTYDSEPERLLQRLLERLPSHKVPPPARAAGV